MLREKQFFLTISKNNFRSLFSTMQVFFVFWAILCHKKYSLLNREPCISKIWSRANVPCTLECWRTHVPVCFARSRANMSLMLSCSGGSKLCVFACSRANVPCVVTSSRANCLVCSRAYVTTCLACLQSQVTTWLRDHLPTCFALLVKSFDDTFFTFTAIVVKVVHTVSKV